MTIGYVYKLVCKDINAKEIYVGSTVNMNQRRRQHKNACNSEKNKHYNYPVYQYIRANSGWENWESVIVETVEYNEKHELKLRERFHLEELKATLNKLCPHRTPTEIVEYDKAHRERYYNEHKEYLKERRQIHNEEHKEQIKQVRGQKYTCECNTEYTRCHKARHEMSRKHLLWFIKQ